MAKEFLLQFFNFLIKHGWFLGFVQLAIAFIYCFMLARKLISPLTSSRREETSNG